MAWCHGAKKNEACKSHSQQNVSIQVCRVCLFLRCSAKTTEQQGVMVITETALQLEDAVLTPTCWQASVPLLCAPEPPLVDDASTRFAAWREFPSALTLGKWVGTGLRCDSCFFCTHTPKHTQGSVCKQRPCEGLRHISQCRCTKLRNKAELLFCSPI